MAKRGNKKNAGQTNEISDKLNYPQPGDETDSGRYSIQKLLSEGGFGRAYLVHDKQQFNLNKVLKVVIGLDSEDLASSLSEFDKLSQVYREHHLVAHYHYYFHNSATLHLIVQFCNGGSLANVIDEAVKYKNTIPREKISDWSLQILSGLEFLHSHGITHRNLNPRNIFIDQNVKIKIGDIGLARSLKTARFSSKFAQDVAYFSLEFINSETYTEKTDLWSFGCVLYELLTLEKIFKGKTAEDIIKSIQRNRIYPVKQPTTLELDFLLKNCLERVETKRLSASNLIICFKLISKTSSAENKKIIDQQVDRVEKVLSEAGSSLKGKSKNPVTASEKLSVAIELFEQIFELSVASEKLASCWEQVSLIYNPPVDNKNTVKDKEYDRYAKELYSPLELYHSLIEKTRPVVLSLKEASDVVKKNNEDQKVINYLLKCIELLTRTGLYNTEGLEYLKLLSMAYYVNGNYTEYFHSSLDAYNMLKKSNLERTKTAAYCLYNISVGHFLIDNYPEELEYKIKAYEILSGFESKNKKKLADCTSTLGMAYGRNGMIEKELEFLSKAEQLYEKLESRDKDEADCSFCLAAVYHRLNQAERELKYLHKAMGIYDELGHLNEKATCLKCIGVVYNRLNRPKEELDNLFKAYQIFELLNVGGSKEMADLMNSVSLAERKNGNSVSELKFKLEADKIYQDLGLTYTLEYAEFLKQMSEAYQDCGNFRQELECKQRAEKIYQRVNSNAPTIEYSDFLYSLSQAYFRNEETSKELEYLIRACRLYRQVKQKESKQSLDDILQRMSSMSLEDDKSLANYLVEASRHANGSKFQLDFLLKGYEMYQRLELGECEEVADCLKQLGLTYFGMSEKGSVGRLGLEYLKKAYDMFERITLGFDDKRVATCLTHLGVVVGAVEADFELQSDYLEKALDIFYRLRGEEKDSGCRDMMLVCLNHLAKLNSENSTKMAEINQQIENLSN